MQPPEHGIAWRTRRGQGVNVIATRVVARTEQIASLGRSSIRLPARNVHKAVKVEIQDLGHFVNILKLVQRGVREG
jgi:hypothetical protein